MTMSTLSDREKNVIYECLKAATDGPFFSENEFHIIFGLHRAEVEKVKNSWPNINEAEESARIAINGSINNLLGYPHRCDNVWDDYLSVSRSELESIYRKWKD